MTPKKANNIYLSVLSYSKIDDMLLELKNKGFSISESTKLVKHYQDKTLIFLEENIYSFKEFIPFSKLDKIFLENHDNYDTVRILECLKEVMERLSQTNGDVYYLKEELNVIDIDEKKYQKQRSKLFNRYDCCGHYVYDLAVQRYIIEQDLKQHPSSFDSHKIRYFLAVLNSDYIFDGTYQDGQPYYPEEEVIALFDFTKLTDEYMEIIERDRNRIEQFLMEPDVSCFPLGEYCERKKTTKCPYTKICYEKVPEHNSVFDYLGSHYGFQNNGIKYSCFDFLNQGIYAMQDVDIRYLNRKANQIQRNVLDTGVPYVDIPKIQDGIRQIQYPIYHLDFETFPCPLPRFPGERCYSQSVFQFSLHVEREPFVCDKENDHYEFLAVDEKDHREELVEKLCSYISSKKGTILVYNSSFEKSRLRELGIIFPKYQKQLEQMCDMIFDLLYVVKTNGAFYQALGYEEERSKLFNYYHPNLYGSFSIKKVLPLFTTLTYDGMEVSNGTDALVTCAFFSNWSSSMYQYKYQKLLEYCKQDTWAMVEILWGLKRFVA